MRILITGVTGFVGGHLVEALLALGQVELFGLGRSITMASHLEGRVKLFAADLCEGAAVEAVLRDVRPERIYHLAGYANAGRSNHEPDAAWAGNLTATRALYDAIQRWGGRPRVLYVGSGLIYGNLDAAGAGFTEDHPLYPFTAYASSKAAADLMSYQYTHFPRLDVVRARPFNHTGPGQSPDYAVPNWARQIAAAERGGEPVIQTGNLDASRDLTDVRDVVQAYLFLMERGRTGVAYNVASGKSYSMKAVLDRLLALARVRVEVRTQPTLLRASESLHHRGDASRLRRETGWEPRYSIDQTLADVLDAWRR